MQPITIFTFDWVPEGPRGFVRDLRLRWAAEEAALPYQIATVPFQGRATHHLDSQPFGQIPFLVDGQIRLFESGACLLHIAQKSEALMPQDPVGLAATTQWVIAALNSLEMVSVPWWYLRICGQQENPLESWLGQRLEQLEAVLRTRSWLVSERFTVADLLMADVLRVPDVRAHGDRPATEEYVRRVTARPAFLKAYSDQIEHFRQADLLKEGA